MSETILPPVSWDCRYQLGNPGAACTTESIGTHNDDPAAHAAAVGQHNGDAAAHGALSRFSQLITWTGGAIRDAAGTGAVNVQNHYVQVRTGTTAGSKSAVTLGTGTQPIFTISAGSTATKLDADSHFVFEFLVSSDGYAASGVARLLFGKVAADITGPLSIPGFAVEIRANRIWLTAWDGALKEVDTGVDISVGSAVLVRVERTTSGFSAHIDGQEVPPLVCGSIGLLATYSAHRVESQNNASAAEHRFNFSTICWTTFLP